MSSDHQPSGFVHFPRHESSENEPLLKSTGERARWSPRRLSARLVTGSLILVAAMCVVPIATVGWIRQAMVLGDQDSHEKAVPRSRFCVAHAAYGSDYKLIAEVSAMTKRRYAEMHGYRFLQYLSNSLDEFVRAYCPELQGQIELAYSKTTPVSIDASEAAPELFGVSQVKSCGIWASLRDSCDYVLWTDADSVLVDSSLRMEDLLYMEPNERVSRDDVARLADKDILFFLEAYEQLGLCPDLFDLEDLAPGDCGSANDFGNCVNTGALIVKSSEFAETLIRDQLALAIFDNDFLLHSPCSTNDLGVGAARNITWDQCMFPGETEQCTLSCLYRNRPQLLEKTMCRVSDDNTTHYLFGTLLDPPAEAISSLKAYGDREGLTIPSENSSMSLYDGKHKPPRDYKGSLVYNCMGGDFSKKLECVTYATFSMWPEMENIFGVPQAPNSTQPASLLPTARSDMPEVTGKSRSPGE